jgi:hypothetical protein
VRINEIKALIRGEVHRTLDVFPNTVILRKPSAICTIENYGKTPAFVDETQTQLRFSADDLQIVLATGKLAQSTRQTFSVPSQGVPIESSDKVVRLSEARYAYE